MDLDVKKLSFRSKLWPHQVEALNVANKYVKQKKRKWDSSCLIALPTGAGKTGIIATLAHFSSFKNILILSPRVNITNQNSINIKGRFFEKIGAKVKLSKNVLVDIPSATSVDSDWISISTIQKIGSLFGRDEKYVGTECSFSALKEKTDLLIIDEGHWEPSDIWKTFLRDFNCPTILFTATPIRNDYSKFKIDTDYVYSKSIQELQKEKYLKKVDFIEIDIVDSVEKYVKEIKKKITTNPQKENDKILVRCESSAEIKELAAEFSKQFPKKKVIGIHVSFTKPSDKNGYLLTHLTPIEDEEREKYDIFIHQYKMVEGFDEPRFGYLALYSPFKNTRQLVQQVGRILRNPKRITGQKGFVFFPVFSKQEDFWKAYLFYDDLTKEKKNDVLNTNDSKHSEKLLKEIECVYLEKLFRKKFNNSNRDVDDYRFLLPLSCAVRLTTDSLDLNKIVSRIEDEFLDEKYDVMFSKVWEEKESFLFFFLEISNSPFLRFEHTVETKNHLIYCRKTNGHFVIYSSTISFYDFFDSLNTSTSIANEKFKRLISSKEKSKISNVYLKNSALSKVQYSSKKLWAHDIKQVPASYDDGFHTPSNFWGFSEDESFEPPEEKSVITVKRGAFVKRRYIGYKNGKITQDSSIEYKISDFDDWSDGIIDMLVSGAVSNPFFDRYSLEVNPPHDPEVFLITFDFDLLMDYLDDKKVKIGDKSELTLEQIFSFSGSTIELENSKGTIHSDVLSRDYSFEVSWDSSSQRFLLNFSNDGDDSLNKFEVVEKGNTAGKTFVDLINTKQAFKIYLKDQKPIVYVDKKFISPRMLSKEGIRTGNDPVLAVLKTTDAFKKIIDEKGIHEDVDWGQNTKMWPKTCLFGLIAARDKSLSPLFDNLKHLVCDDQQTESCDFVAVTEKRVSFIHAKASENGSGKGHSRFGIKHIGEVLNQAKKNLGHLNALEPQIPKYVDRWGKKDWKESKGNASSASIHRIIFPTEKPKEKSKEYWEKYIHSEIKKPSIEKYAVCVVSNGFSKSKFLEYLKDETHANHTEAIHAYYLILGLVGAAQQLGVKVEIYCDK